MTPPDCDVRSLAFMPPEVERLLDSDLFALSTGDEFKAALALWARSWRQVPAGSIPADERIQAKLAGVSVTEWRGLAPRALHGWQPCADGRLYHPVIAEKAITAWLEHLRFQERSARGNAARYGRELDPTSFAKAAAAGIECLHRLSPKAAAKYGNLPQGAETAPTRSPEPVLQGGKNAPKGKGKGKVPPVGTLAPSSDPNKEAWQRAIALLIGVGVSEQKARSFFGKLLRDHAIEARDLLTVVVSAELSGSADPQSYLTKAARGVAQRRGCHVHSPTSGEWGHDEWATAVRLYRQDGTWSSELGPKPDEPGCRAPDTILGPPFRVIEGGAA
jgi:hypothetical protein